MPHTVRIASFNLENFDNKTGQTPTLNDRIKVMKPQLIRLNADVLCLQEVNGQEIEGEPRQLLALDELLSNTQYAAYHRVSTLTSDHYQVYDERNLVILSRYEIISHAQYRNDKINSPVYGKVTASPPEGPKEVDWERPILLADIRLPGDKTLHVLNVHLKSKIPTNVSGQRKSTFVWRSAAGWAEGFFISSMKRVGQALETRVVIDELFDQDEDALIAVCGDFNAAAQDVPVLAIRGDVEQTGNGDLATRALIPCERGIPESTRFTLFHHGKPEMIDHLLVSRSMLQYFRLAEIHNEQLHDESVAFAVDKKYPESDHAPIIAEFLISGL